MLIEGSGVVKYGLLVDSQGRAQVYAATESEDRHINQNTGKVWSVPFAVTTTAPNVYVAYIKNIGTKNLHVTDIRIRNLGTASGIDVDDVSGTVAGETAVVPISRNIGNAVIAAATTVEATAGTGLTGLTDRGLLFPKYAGANAEMKLSTTSNIVIPPGQAMAVKALVSGAALTGTISLVEVEVEGAV